MILRRRRFECPACGCRRRPRRVVRCAERIAFYNCRAGCGFSTWEAREFGGDRR